MFRELKSLSLKGQGQSTPCSPTSLRYYRAIPIPADSVGPLCASGESLRQLVNMCLYSASVLTDHKWRDPPFGEKASLKVKEPPHPQAKDDHCTMDAVILYDLKYRALLHNEASSIRQFWYQVIMKALLYVYIENIEIVLCTIFLSLLERRCILRNEGVGKRHVSWCLQWFLLDTTKEQLG